MTIDFAMYLESYTGCSRRCCKRNVRVSFLAEIWNKRFSHDLAYDDSQKIIMIVVTTQHVTKTEDHELESIIFQNKNGSCNNPIFYRFCFVVILTYLKMAATHFQTIYLWVISFHYQKLTINHLNYCNICDRHYLKRVRITTKVIL